MKPKASLEAKMTQLKPSHFRHIVRRQGPLGKTVMLGKIEGSRKGGRLTMRWVSIEAGIGRSLLLLSRAIEDRTWMPLVTGRRS